MIINVTEDQKKVIESQGYMVIEFKKWANETIEKLIAWGYKVVDTFTLIYNYLEQMEFRVLNCFERFGIELSKRFKVIEEECDWRIEPSMKYPFIRQLGRKYEVRYQNPIIYHRCRNNC